MHLVRGNLIAFHRAFQLSNILKSMIAAAAVVTFPLKTFSIEERNCTCAGKQDIPSLKKCNQLQLSPG